MFNLDQVKSFVRSVVIGAGAFVVGKGWVTAEYMAEIAGGAAALVAALWGLYFHGGVTKVALAEVVVGTAPRETEDKTIDAAVKLAGTGD